MTHTDTLDCGHPKSTTDGIGTGYARLPDNTRICYACAADLDKRYAASMTKDDAPLVAYVQEWPALGFYDSRNRIKVVTWAGVELGWGWQTNLGRDGWNNPVRYVRVTIGGREFYGRHYPDSGDYVRLRPRKGRAQ